MRLMPLIALATTALLAGPAFAAPLDQGALMRTMLSAHNAKRAAHGSPALIASARLTVGARTRVDALCAAGSTRAGTPPSRVGENVHSVRAQDPPAAGPVAQGAVDAWYAEIEAYDFTQPGTSPGTGHFTQLVWKDTTKVGCAACRNVESGPAFTMVVCQYASAGNFMNAFEANVRPARSATTRKATPPPR